VLAGFPDRVAKRIRDTELALVGGKAAQVSRSDALHGVEFLVALDATERHDSRGRRITVKTVFPIEPDWLLELFPDDVEATSELLWAEQRQRVEEVERLQYGALVLEESRGVARPSDASSELLAEQAEALGPEAFAPAKELEGFIARLQVLRKALPEAKLPDLDRGAARRLLATLCTGRVSFAELREAGLLDALRAELDHQQLRMLAQQAPEQVSLPCGRSIPIRYEPDKPPWIASRLQDFFGMKSGPRLARGRVSLVLHLLAPNGRPVQITQDLESFWRQTYPAIRGQLRGRYPKHDWPEDGASATAPRPGRLRGR
jgi:ATP-dependent helicase HrpB